MPTKTTKGKTVSKAAASKASNAAKARENFNRQDNIHNIFGIVLILFGLRQLRDIILGVLLLLWGILLVTGFFEDKK